MKRKLVILSSVSSFLLFTFTLAHAVPNLISYQGVLYNNSGTPMSSTLMIVFAIYDVETGGTALWSETQSVAVSNGVFNVKLGLVNPLTPSVFLSDTLYLGIQVGADPEMTPRQQITAGAYVDSVIPIGTILAWAKSLAGVPALPDGWIECNGQIINDPQSVLNGQTIPNLNGENRFLRGASASGGKGGEEYHTLIINEMPAHSHSYASVRNPNSSPSYFAEGGSYPRSENTGSTGGSQPHENRPPFFNVVWIMKIK